MPEAVFVPEADAFLPTERALSPWSSSLLHGGPAAGLLARAAEHWANAARLVPARFTFELFRPIPRAPLRTELHTIREGRRIAVIEVRLLAEGETVSRASVVLLRPSPVVVPPTASFEPLPFPRPEHLPPTTTEPTLRLRGSEGFHTTLEVRRIVPSVPGGGGRAAAWVRLPCEFVAGEPTSPLVHAAAVSDFANGLAHISAGPETGFINVDITLALHRFPKPGWLAIDATSGAERSGLGLITARLYDDAGQVGALMQTLLANPRQAR